jgi:hypothetical protein
LFVNNGVQQAIKTRNSQKEDKMKGNKYKEEVTE